MGSGSLLDYQVGQWPPNLSSNHFGSGPQISLLKGEVLAPFKFSVNKALHCETPTHPIRARSTLHHLPPDRRKMMTRPAVVASSSPDFVGHQMS